MGNYHTIKGGIVQDALAGFTKCPFPSAYIGGGISLQFTLPDELHRQTSDIDFSSSKQVSYGTFKEIVEGSIGDLARRGYELSFKKSRNTFDAHLVRDENRLMVQHPRRGGNNFTKRKHILEREVENARTVPCGDGEIRLITYEDLVAHKVTRSTTFIDRYNLQSKANVLRRMGLPEMKQEIDELKREHNIQCYSLDPGDVASTLARIRMTADIFDMKAVYDLFSNEFDEKYFREALSSFDRSGVKMTKWLSLNELVQ